MRLLALALAGLAALAIRAPARPGEGRAEILWDTWGVPHIVSADGEGALYAFGWAQAEAHGDLLLRLYAEARGQAAMIRGAELAEQDRLVLTLGIPARAEAWYAAQTAEERALLDAFAAGVNGFARAHPEAIDDGLEGLLPVGGADVLAHLQRVIHFTFLSQPGRLAQSVAAGSNGWAIAPSRSASGHAMLLVNPHLPWFGLFTLFEAHLVAPGLDVYGATFVGLPLLAFAFNDRLAWTHTVNPIDGADLYELILEGDGYRWDGAARAFDARPETLRVRHADGSIHEEPFLALSSVHGPVIARRGDRAYALRVTGLDRPHLLGQYWRMARARDLGAFEAALAELQNPMFNVIYADRDGHVLYVFNGLVPVRPSGGWADWTGIVRGDTSATLWTETHAYEDLPRILDPPSGWVQSANDPPWTATLPLLEPERFPSYLAPRGVGLRPQRSMRMLVEDEQISFEELVAYKHSTRVELADRVLDELVAAARRRGGRAASAAEVLARWDRSTDGDSRGAVLFQAFYEDLERGSGSLAHAFATPWSAERPLATPSGLADRAAAVDALEAAALRLEEAHGAIDVVWGEIYRLRRDTLDLPGNGADDPLGVFRATGYAEDRDGRLRAIQGDSWVAAIEFGDPPRAMGVLGYGNWSRPGSPHRTDQLPLYAEKRLRPILRTGAEIEAHLERREVLP